MNPFFPESLLGASIEKILTPLLSTPAGRLVEEAFSSGSLPGPHRLYTGDNLPVLKLLMKEIKEQVRVIYIDPPYNTGTILNYHDRFSVSAGKKDDRSQNPLGEWVTTPGQDHRPWIEFMFPRLALARKLLRPDGVLFVSIDDREYPRLRLLLDWIMGETNHAGTIVWRKKVVRGRGKRHIIPQTEYIVVYAKEIGKLPPFREPLTDEMIEDYTKIDERGAYKEIPLAKSGTAHSPRPNLVYPITAPDGSEIPCPTHQWRWSRKTFEARQDEILFRKTRNGVWRVLTKQYLETPSGRRFRTPTSLYEKVTTTDGTKELKEIAGSALFDFPKPSRLIRDLLSWATSSPKTDTGPEIILDFFAGTAPTAQAVLDLNREDHRNRICYLVQNRTHPPDEEDKILEMAKKRIRKCQDRLAEPRDIEEESGGTDCGFRLFHYLPSPDPETSAS